IQWDRDNLTPPRWMVSLASSHVPPYTQPGDPAFELNTAITIAFLDGTLKGHPERLDDVTDEVDAQPSVATIEREHSAALVFLEESLHLAPEELAGGGLRDLLDHHDALGGLERA